MEKTLKVKFKIADIIEFEAEGTTEDVEKQRTAFMENIFPAAVNAVRANREQSWQQIKSSPIELLPIDSTESPKIGIAGLEDLSRTNLSSFLNRYGELSEQDFVLFAAYFDEKKNDKKEFNSDSVKKYYSEARRAPYSNNSMLISQLVKRGHIMQVEPYSETKGAKGYMLTDDGLKYVETYVAKEENSEKKIRKSRRNNSKIESQYKGLTADDLNLEIYPKVKDLEKSTENSYYFRKQFGFFFGYELPVNFFGQYSVHLFVVIFDCLHRILYKRSFVCIVWHIVNIIKIGERRKIETTNFYSNFPYSIRVLFNSSNLLSISCLCCFYKISA